MIARYGDRSWIDIDQVSSFSYDISDSNPENWWASFVVAGVCKTIRGRDVENLYEAYRWKWGQTAYDMRVSSLRFKKQGE